MSIVRRHRSARPLPRTWFRHGAAALLSTVLLVAGSAKAWADESMILDLVRHGESGQMSVINTLVPGPPLTELGRQQAQAVADVLKGTGIDEIFASTMIRSQETAAPLAALLSLPVQVLPGLDEINAGVFEGMPVNVGGVPLGGVGYLLAPALWTLGLYFVPELGSSDVNGMAFEDRFGGAVQTIYDTSVASGGGRITDAVFSHEGAIAIWTLMNVNNPDFGLVLTELLKTGELLPYTGVVVLEGDPVDGWTLVSWDGQPVPPASLPTELFVDVRDVITAPQMAAYHITEAILTGDPTTIVHAVQDGANQVGAAAVNFPLAVIRDLGGAVGLGGGVAGAELAHLVPAAVADVAGLLPGELAATVGAALAAF